MSTSKITVDFSTFEPRNVEEFAENAIGLRDWLTVTGQRDSEAFRAADAMWQAARERLAEIGWLDDFLRNHGMD